MRRMTLSRLQQLKRNPLRRRKISTALTIQKLGKDGLMPLIHPNQDFKLHKEMQMSMI
jgi:hypothetical protein